MRLCNALSFVAVVACVLSCKEDNTTISPPGRTPFPSFGAEESVTIHGYSTDAMEPFISHDGTFLFFNSLNNGTNTSLYYARRTDDASFNFVGMIGGVNQTQPPYLDAVASMDGANSFYWVSTRNYPHVFENLHRGNFSAGTVSKVTRVYGDLYTRAAGWIVMDASIHQDGDLLCFVNAYFNNCPLPCEAKLGFARKVNDSTFNRISTSDNLLMNVNDTSYVVYAPTLTRNGLELYFTRIRKGTLQTEICVSVRRTTSDAFEQPSVIHSDLPAIPEAATLTMDAKIMYYHKKVGGVFKIFMRRRVS